MKKLISVSLAAILALTLTACGAGKQADKSAGAEAGSDYPNKPINLIISYAAGGVTDVGARALMPYVEKELGVPINVINKPGGGGWVGWTELAMAKPDGYTIGYLSTPNLMTGYLDPKQKREHNLESFTLIANHVTDYGAIAIRPNEKRFTDIKGLIEYAKKNEVTTTSTGVGSDDHYAALKLNKNFGTKFTPVQNKGTAESATAVIGGHVDVLVGNVGELAALHKNGELKVIGVMAEERSSFLPDVPTLKESGFEGVTSHSARGIAGPKGLDPKVLEKLQDAFEKGIKNAEQVKKQEELGLMVDYKEGEDYLKLLKDDEKGVLELRELLGW